MFNKSTIYGEADHSRSTQTEIKLYLESQFQRQDEKLSGILKLHSNESESSQTPASDLASEVIAAIPLYEKETMEIATTKNENHLVPQRHPQSTACINCRCSCHNTRMLLTPSVCDTLFGSLLIGSRGNLLSTQRCNERTCRRRTTPLLTAAYYTPHWLAMRAVFLTLLCGASPKISISFAKIVPADSELFRCIHTGQIERIHELFEHGNASPDDMVESRYGVLNALLYALNCSQYEVCRLLLSWGADPHVVNSTALTSSPADMAWNLKHEYYEGETSPRRLDDFFPEPRDLESRSFSRLHKVVIGVSHGSLDAVLNSLNFDINAKDRHGRAAVHWAAWKGDASVIIKLLNAGTDPDLYDGGRRTPMHFAAMTRTSTCTKALIDAGADFNWPDDFHETPLHCACSTRRIENIITLLHAGADADASTTAGITPLMSALLAGEIEAVKILLAHGVDIEAKDDLGETAVTTAIWLNAHEIVEALIIAGARLDVINRSGRTVLHTAAQFGDVAMMEVLEKSRITMVDPAATNAEGLMALEVLRQREDYTKQLNEAFGSLLISVRWYKGPYTLPNSSENRSHCNSENSELEEDEGSFFDAMESLES
jgi:ankyrin repeat protein